MYKIIGGDGKEYGPVSIEQLRAWQAQRRITVQTRVQLAGGTEWLPAGQVAELASLFAAPPLPVGSSSAPPLLTAQAPRRRQSGLAVFSFILGLCSFALCLGAISGLPAIIIGHVARRRATRSPERYGGKGLAISGVVLGYLSIFATILIVSALMQGPLRRGPGSFRHRPGPPPISDCQNNLRQLGLALKVWALDHNDQYPFNVSTNAGGSLEFCDRDAEGFEKDPVPHLIIIANDLGTPAFLVCPKDSSKRAAPDFSSLRAENVSYRLRTGTNINANNPQEVLAVCPIHGNELYVDGNVRKKPGR